MNETTRTVLSITVAALVGVLMTAIMMIQPFNLTEAVCDHGHNATTAVGYWEDACGSLQKATNTEYMCNRTMSDCWLETK